MTMIFDTLKLSKSLQKAFTPDQAEASTEALNATVTEGVASKNDILALRSEILGLRSDTKDQIAGLKEQLAGLRDQVAGVKVDLVRWIVSAIAFNLLATAGLMITLIKTLR